MDVGTPDRVGNTSGEREGPSSAGRMDPRLRIACLLFNALILQRSRFSVFGALRHLLFIIGLYKMT